MNERERPPSFKESCATSLEIVAHSPTLGAMARVLGVSLGTAVGVPAGGTVGGILSEWGLACVLSAGVLRWIERPSQNLFALKTQAKQMRVP